MGRGSTMFLQGVIFLIGIGVLALCVVVFPWVISSGQAGYYSPLLLGMYVPAIPFFIALYQTLKLLRYIDKNKAFSPLSVQALKNIKYCAGAVSALYAVGMPYILYVAELDDAPGAVAIGLVIIFASLVIAVFAAVLEQLLQNAIAIKSENDLTV
ncbi:MAG: DUF2975 domain-containing protein [Candidatus Andersenbacteria bacterium]